MANVYPLARTLSPAEDIVITVSDDGDAVFDGATGTTQIDLEDGSVQITWGPPPRVQKDSEHEDNLAEELTESDLSVLAERILLGIEQDLQTRTAWLENMSAGLSLLGLEIKNPRGAAASGAAPAEGTSTVDHPLLLEAVLRFQANARGELLPADGPVKVRNDGEGNALADALATALEKDLNRYLTKTATEYYPDTDRMLLMLGFSGISFKKGYHDPIKRRPVIASIDAADLIVSNAATDLEGAGRVTHRIMMRPSVLKRMQLLGAYRNIDLPVPGLPANKDAVDTKIDQIQGIAAPTSVEPADQERELYECYCEIEVPGFEHTLDGEETGLPLPYKVVIDKDARRILEIRRNWDEDDLYCMPRNRIIAYVFIPGLGFYGIGLLNILGNATKAVTAAWRLMLDSGMYSNFPGFLYLKSLSKQLSNQFRIPPGGGMPIDTTGADIRASIMPLPYKDPSAVFIQLIDNVVETAQRVGGTTEMQVGEGRQDAPVGTTLAMIEQATKLISAVHKRMLWAQGQEFDMLKGLLMEDPEALWRHNKKKSMVLKTLLRLSGQQPLVDAQKDAEERHREMFLAALADCELVPRADPNTSSQTERYLKAVALRQLAMSNQSMDLNAVDKRALQVMGIDDADTLFKPPAAPGAEPPNPEAMTAQATMIAAQARLTESQTRAQEAAVKAQNSARDTAIQAITKRNELSTKERIAALGVSRELVIHQADRDAIERASAAKLASDSQHRTADRAHRLMLASMAGHNAAQQGLANRTHQTAEGAADRTHQFIQGLVGRRHEAIQGLADRQHELAMARLAQENAPEPA
jgi:hypothetical protein